MDKLKMHSMDGVAANIDKIGALFPNCVTETLKGGKVVRAIDFDMLRQELSDVVVEGPTERYQFTWPEKRKSVLAANAPTTDTLRPDRATSEQFDTTENLYIEGDNLVVLKLLQETYLGRIKVIYIDPPYNTGSDFVYADNFSENAEDYIGRSGDIDDEGNRLVKNINTNGRFHTDWLNMIYPRLRIAKNLLATDGVIFISIDDHEQENLKKICDEIFGPENFLAQVIWERAYSPVNLKKHFSESHELLLSFDNPVRFIFSHSALREGWDNPNVFQICTLKHGGSSPTQKRQEVGRGLRLCVDQKGERMDAARCGDTVHSLNLLTVIASEGYSTFVSGLQDGIKEALYDRPSKATTEYFIGKTVMVGEQPVVIDAKQAKDIYKYLLKNDYIDDDDNITADYRKDKENGILAALPETLAPIADGVHSLIQSVFDPSVLAAMVEDGNKTKIIENKLNENFAKQQFQTLWSYINHKYAYTVEFDSAELIKKAIDHINDKMYVTRLQYTVTSGVQTRDMDQHAIERRDGFDKTKTRTETLMLAESSQIKYDLIGKIAEGTYLTRRTVAAILSGLQPHVFAMFKHNPEEFINKAIKLIREQKATMIVEHISYDQTEQVYDSDIFTAEKGSGDFAKAYRAKKHIQDYVFTDGTADKSIERRFAEDLDRAEEVCVYAKLPKGFHIPTPVGNYSPDWAIAFNEGTVKHIFFIAETKGTMDSLNLRPIEQAKIACAKKLFNSISTSKVRYHDVDSYQSLLDIMGKL